MIYFFRIFIYEMHFYPHQETKRYILYLIII